MLISVVAEVFWLHLFLKVHITCGLGADKLQLTVVIAACTSFPSEEAAKKTTSGCIAIIFSKD